MIAAQLTATYLIAQIRALAIELRNPQSVLTRDQLAELADRAHVDASSIVGLGGADGECEIGEVSDIATAKILPFIRR